MHHRINSLISSISLLYGITQDPVTKNYIMVLNYAKHGSLRNYLDMSYDKLSWDNKFRVLSDIASGLLLVHRNGLIHRDFHIGNILWLTDNIFSTQITDFGLCRPADNSKLENINNNSIYGVLPYVAPEILRGQNYTKAADIYSFGIIMYEVISGLPPYHDVSHDRCLALKICLGLRPRFNIKVPQLIVHSIKRCLDTNPLNRPTADEIQRILVSWWFESDNNQSELKKQIKEAEEINNLSTNNTFKPTCLALSYEKHSEAIYTSRLLNFNDLPEPKNSDDYYEQNDNIISEEYSGNCVFLY
jgi:serine/threonine protein kinase